MTASSDKSQINQEAQKNTQESAQGNAQESAQGNAQWSAQGSDSPRPRSYVASILFACLLIVAGIYLPLVLLLSFAMLPSVLIRSFGKKENKDLIFAVTGLNFVGTILTLQYSYKKYGLNPEPGTLFADWVNWLLPFGMAWLGILIFMILPTIMAVILEITLQNKEQNLRKQQNSLLKAWGRQIRNKPDKKKEQTAKIKQGG